MHRLIAIAAALAASTSAAAAFAAPQHLTDVQYIEASRCLGIMSAKATASPDQAALKDYLERQGWSRAPAVMDEADEARQDAESAAGRSAGFERAQLLAERDGVCRTFAAATSAAAQPRTDRSLQ